MDYFTYSLSSRPSTPRQIVITMVLSASIALRLCDIILGGIRALEILDFQRTHKKLLAKNPEMDALLTLMEYIQLALVLKNLTCGNIVDTLFLTNKHKTVHVTINFAFGIFLVCRLNSPAHRLAITLPAPLNEKVADTMVYLTIFHAGLPIALVAWILFLHSSLMSCHDCSDCTTRLEVDTTDEAPAVQITPTVVHIPRQTPLPDMAVLESDSSDCCICMEPIPKNSQIRALSCKHVYHTECLDKWLLMDINHKCPLCANPV